jgi:pyruvate formate lyase activating enzyme
VCHGRKNIDGTLYAINYGEVVSMAMDPIEKKPLYHFHPGMPILSIAPNGCNLTCEFCQNWQIAQDDVPTRYVTPQEMVDIATKKNSEGIAYTYSEPLIWYEYIMDCGKLAHDNGLYNVLVSNGHIAEEPFRELAPVIDAMNIDIKAMTDEFYKNVCGGKLEVVLRTAEIAKKSGIHVEITNLVIPGYNDSDEELNKLVDWIKEHLGEDTPLHFSRYFPNYKFDAPPTPNPTLEKAFEIGNEKLWYVFVGNTYIEGSTDSYCHNCGNDLIERKGYGGTGIVGLTQDAKCDNCGAESGIIL